MFKGKVYMYKNINGKEEKIEREFDNQEEFNAFAKSNMGWVDQLWNTRIPPLLGMGDWINLHNYFDKLIDQKLGLTYLPEEEENPALGLDVDLDKYEQELEKIEYQKQHQKEHLESLKSTLQKLKEYKKRFKEEGKDDLVEQVNQDIKKVEDEMSKYETK